MIIPPISTILHHAIYYNLSFKYILLIIYVLMNKYYLFSFISNKLIIMNYFTNDSANKLVITLFTIFLASKVTSRLKIWFLNLPTQKFAGLRSDSFAVEILSKWRRIWKIRNMGFVQNGPNYLPEEQIAQIRLVQGETQGSLSTIFSDLQLRPSSKSQLQTQIRLVFVEEMKLEST